MLKLFALSVKFESQKVQARCKEDLIKMKIIFVCSAIFLLALFGESAK